MPPNGAAIRTSVASNVAPNPPSQHFISALHRAHFLPPPPPLPGLPHLPVPPATSIAFPSSLDQHRIAAAAVASAATSLTWTCDMCMRFVVLFNVDNSLTSWINRSSRLCNSCESLPAVVDICVHGDHHYICNPHHGTHIYCVKKTKRPGKMDFSHSLPPKPHHGTHGALLMWQHGHRSSSGLSQVEMVIIIWAKSWLLNAGKKVGNWFECSALRRAKVFCSREIDGLKFCTAICEIERLQWRQPDHFNKM